jgi:outer membrane protein, multidrug efflux system
MNLLPIKPLALAAAAALAGCSFIPVHETPAPPVASSWADAGTAAGTPAADLA